MKILSYINPINTIKSIVSMQKDLAYYRKYVAIIDELEKNGDLQRLKIIREKDILLVGVDVNPEILVYQEETITSAELRLVGERMKKYTAFLQKHGILDVIKADYERIKTEDYYGYLVNISYDFKKYDRTKLMYRLIYLAFLISLIGGASMSLYLKYFI